jgi:hypothetical protein
MAEPKQYPEALFKCLHYRSLVARLRANQRNISNEMGGTRGFSVANYESSNLSGDFYTEYLKARDRWVSEKDAIVAEFDRFLLDLDACIVKARSLEHIWQSRIGT